MGVLAYELLLGRTPFEAVSGMSLAAPLAAAFAAGRPRMRVLRLHTHVHTRLAALLVSACMHMRLHCELAPIH